MQKSILIILMLCTLSTQVFGSVVHGDEHSSQGDTHALMHEIGQPHSHGHSHSDGDDHEEKVSFTLSYSDEAMEHVNADAECCLIALLELPASKVSLHSPSSVESYYTNNWSSPFLQYIKPPPRY